MPNRVAFFSCAKFAWMKPLALACLRRAWPECTYPIDWVSDDDGAGWARTFKRYAEQHKADRVLVMLDDYMADRIDVHMLGRAFRVMNLYDCVRVCPCPGPTLRGPSVDIGEIDPSQPYAVSLQPAVWRPMALAKLIDDDWNPWQVEIEGSKRAAERCVQWAGTIGRCVDYFDLARRGVIQSDNLARAARMA